MKNIFRYIYALMAMTILLTVVSCEEDMVDPVTITDINVTSLFQGEDISLTGEGFDQVQFLFLGDVQLEYTLEENTITFTVPDTYPVGMATITLAMKGARRETQEVEVLLKPTPVIGPFTPFVPVGEDVTITGTSLDNNTIVAIDGVPASIVSASDTELVVTVPSGVDTSGPIDIKVTTDYGSDETPTAFYAMENMLANSDLEAGEGDDFTDWEQLNNGDGITELLDAYGGTRSIHVAPTGANPWSTQMASTGVPLTMGAEYTIVMWAKADADGAFMRVSASQYDGAGADYFYGADQEIAANAWQQYTWTFTVGKDLATHRVVLDMGAGSVPFAIDHIGLVPGSVGSAEAPDLMIDGNFESGALPGDETGWSVLNGDITITSDARCGSSAVQAVGAGSNPWSTQLASAHLPLEVDQTYEVSFWAKAAGPDGVMRVSVSQYDGNGADYFYGHDITVAESWTQYSYVFTAAVDLVDGHRIVFDMGTTTQTFMIDDVVIKEFDEESNLLADPGFESGALPGDEATGWQLLNGDVTITTADVNSGTNAVQVVGAGSNPWNTQLASELLSLTFGSRYSVKVRAKAASGEPVMRISVSQYDGNGADYYYGHDVTIGGEWATYTWNFEVTNDLVDGHKIVLDMGTTTETFYIDDIVVQEIDAAECE